MWTSSFSPSGVRGAAPRVVRARTATRPLAKQAFSTAFQPPPGAGYGAHVAPAFELVGKARQGPGHPDASLPVIRALLAVDGEDAPDLAVGAGGDLDPDVLLPVLL